MGGKRNDGDGRNREILGQFLHAGNCLEKGVRLE